MTGKYQVFAQPPLSPPGTSLELLKELAAALEELGRDLEPVLSELEVEETELALNTLGPKDRQAIMQHLGFRKVEPRRFGRVLSEQVLKRMQRLESRHGCQHAVRLLTSRVMSDIDRAVWEHAPARTGRGVVDRWGARLLYLAIFANLQASVSDARLIAWAAEHEWFGIPGDEAARQAACAVAQQAIDAAPGFEPGLAAAAPEGADAPDSALMSDVRAAHSAVEPAVALAGVSAPPGPPDDDKQPLSPEGLTAVGEEVRELFTGAREAGERLRTTLAEGLPPVDEDLGALAAVAPAFYRALAELSRAGHAGVVERLDEVLLAVEEICSSTRQSEEHARIRDELATVLTFGTFSGNPLEQVVSEARKSAAALLARPAWDAEDEVDAHRLSLLVRLVGLRDRSDARETVIELQQQLSVAHPPYAVAAVLYEQIVVADHRLENVDPPAGASSPTGELTEAAAGARPAEEETASHEAAPAGSTQTHETEPQLTEQQSSPARLPRTRTEPPSKSAVELSNPASEEESRSEGTAPGSGSRAEDIERVLAHLTVERRFGLAAHLSRKAGRLESESAVLRLAAVAQLLRSRTGRTAQAIEETLHDWDVREGGENGELPLLLLPMLVRAALVTGAPVVGAQLRALAPQLPGALHEVATMVAERTLQGVLLIAPPHAVITDVSQVEAELRAAVDSCQALLTAPRLRFQRATVMVQRWVAPAGMLGSVLTAIVNAAPEASQRADDLLNHLGRRTQVEAAIDEMDAALRGTGGRGIQGAGRNNVRQFLERVRETVREWRAVARDLEAGRSEENRWVFKSVAALRLSLLGLRERVAGDLATAERSASVLSRATASVAGELFTEVLDDLEADSRPVNPGPEPEVGQVLEAELHKVRRASGEEPSIEGLMEAVDRTWDDAIADQIDRDEFGVVRTITDLADLGVLPAAYSLTLSEERRTQLSALERNRHTVLTEKHRQLVARLRRSQADEALTVEQDVSLQELLADANALLQYDEQCDLSAVRRNLDRVEELLPRYREEAAARLRARLAALTGVSAEDRDRILRNLHTDSLATAAELVYFLELGEPVPEIRSEDSHLEAFFPVVPDALPGGIDEELVTVVRSRGRYGDQAALDYAALSAEEAERAAAELELWSRLATTRDRSKINPRESLNPALSLLGYEARRARPLDDLPRGKDYRFFELADVHITGRAWAPAFGSQIKDGGGKLRALLIWGRPTAKLLISRILQDPDESSLLVVHFGTLDSHTRIELAAASRGTKPIMVVDDAALAYLTAHGNRRVDAATETLLPFSAVNPYIKEKRGQIGREMFYGRDRERKSIHDPAGTQIIYGGRGLGKSALLADAGDRFEEQRPGAYRKLYLNLDKIGIGRGTALGADAIWPTLDQELIREGVLKESPRRGVQQESWQRVTDGIAQWLREDTDRRLLILLDECDRFFEADVPECTETRRLRGLGEDSRGRAKVVFAGLHSVQRFTRLARNGPFSHLAQTPTVVGPLAPQFAADLIVHPMRALGFEFVDVDLVNRVLGFCSYQPFLLQIFGSRMVEVMQGKRAGLPLGPPPFMIEESDVDAVEQDASLRSDITAAFKDTLALDDRYHVIANVLAQHARANGLETRLSDRELREECAGWWPRGFELLDSEGFRAYLQEMVGLGVLAPNNDGQGWHLRGPNALRMIGTAQEIESRLFDAEKESRLEETVVLESRPDLPDGRSAPLTVNQIDYLLGEPGNQVRVVLGSPATGVQDVEQTLREVTCRVAGWSVPVIGSANTFRRELAAGQPDERRLLISDLAEGSEKSCRESLELARTVLPQLPEAARSVVLVSGVGQIEFWAGLLSGTEADPDSVVVLRRHDLRGLRDWTQRHSFCETEERLARLSEVTGGWPVLLDKALELRGQHNDQDGVLLELADWLGQKSGAEWFVENVGLLDDSTLKAAYFAVVDQLGIERHGDAYLVTAAEMTGLTVDEASWAISCLEALQVLERDGSQLGVEPVVLAALGVLGAGG